MSLIDPVLRYALDSTDNLTTDLIGSADATSSNVTITTDATYGDAATFNGASSIIELTTSVPSALSGNASRTVSMWVNMNALGNTNIFTQGNSTGGGNFYWIKLGLNNNIRFESSVSGNNAVYSLGTISTDTWYNVVWTYNGSTTVAYVNGSQVGSISESLNTDTGLITIGGTPSSGNGPFLNGEMLDFRIYDQALNSTDVSTLFSTGPESGLVLSATMYTHVADLTWTAVSGATTYTVTQTEDAGDPVTIADAISDLTISSYNLNPGSSYEYNLYTDLDLVTPLLTITESALAVDTTSVTDLMVRLDNDLTIIDENSVDEIEIELRNVLSTGDKVALTTGNAVFVQQSDTIEVVTGKDVLTPFESSLVSGSVTVTTAEGDSSVITYDETLNQVTFDGSTVLDVGNYTIIGKYKVRVAEI